MKPTRISMQVALACLALSSAAPPAFANNAPGEIVSLQGKGDYREEKETNWRTAAVKQKLAPASFVRTGELSTIGILLADQTQIKIGQNSIFQVRAVAGQPPEKNTQLDLRKGKAWSQTKNAGDGLFVTTPSARAGIHGTDWVIEVDDTGKTSLTVFSGVIELANDQGRVSVGRNEYAEAEIGKAPVKRTLVSPKERVQWVTTHAFSPERYRELATGTTLPDRTRDGVAAGLAAATRGDYGAAMASLTKAGEAGESPLPWLLAGDLALARGEQAQARALYEKGRARFGQDGRFAAGLGRVALYSDDLAAARQQLEISRADTGSALLSALLAGDIARIEGHQEDTFRGFDTAIDVSPGLADGWFGRGSARLEVEDVKRSRHDLTKALELAREPGYTLGELGTLETIANDLVAGRTHFEKAIATNPGDYVALTGLGLLELKAGNTDKAFAHLIAANTIEPRYARSVLYLGVAYYLSGNVKAGLESLQRASELDDKDPLPHLMISLIHQDQRQPAAAIESAQAAVQRMPNLKSLNQVANDQKGSASLGGAVAQFGLEDWAMAQAQQSYYPYWGGSHLFLADRYQERFNKNSELMQGFLADPTVFGADPRRQTLLMQPGDHVALSARGTSSRSLSVLEPGIAVNGYHNAQMPLAYFVETLHDRVRPGDANFSANVLNTTVGLGLKPNHETGIFVYANRFSMDSDDRAQPQEPSHLDGTAIRFDTGLSYKFGPKSQLWLKAGQTNESTIQDSSIRDGRGTVSSRSDNNPRNNDLQARHTLALSDATELTYGVEWAKGRFDLDVFTTSVGANSGLVSQTIDTVRERDTSRFGYVSLQTHATARWLLQGDLHWMHYEKSIVETDSTPQGDLRFGDQRLWGSSRTHVYPRVGTAIDLGASMLVRAAYQEWRRPISYNTMAPIATAGIPLANQYVLPGGEATRGRLQLEWKPDSRTFVSGFADVLRVSNLHLKDTGADNQRQELADLDRLRLNRPINIGSLESLENRSVFSEGLIRSTGIVGNRVLTSTLTGYAGYAYTWTENRSPWLAGVKLPWLPKHRTMLGATWNPDGQWTLQAQATHRSARFADELNSQEVPAGWDMSLKASYRSPNRNVWLDVGATNLLKRGAESVYGLSVTLRY